MKTLKLQRVTRYFGYILLVAVLFTSCIPSTKPKDLEPIISRQFKDAKAVYYPSSDYKAAAVIVDKNGNVWYVRLNATGELKDNKQLFNVSEYCH